MPIIRYGKTGLFGQGNLGAATPTYTPPTYTPTPSPPMYQPKRTYTPPTPTPPAYTPPTYTPPYTPPPTYYTPSAKRRRISPGGGFLPKQGTPSYVPPPTGTPTQVNPAESGLEPEGSGPAQLVYSTEGYGGGGAYGPSQQIEAEIPEETPPEEPKKTNWMLWLLLAAGAYLFLGGDIL